jgi:sterol 14-demethylase
MKPTPPLLTGAPIVGNLFEFIKDRPTLLQKGFETYGPIFTIKLVTQPVVALIGPEYHQTFFTETDKKLSLHTKMAALWKMRRLLH